MPTELGTHNPRIADVAGLQKRKEARAGGRFAIEGPTLIAEALDAGLAIPEAYVVAATRDHPVVARLEAAGSGVYVVEDRAMRRLSDLETPPGMLAVVAHPPAPLAEVLGGDGPVLALAVGDPGNAGTLIRSAEAFGVGAVVFGEGGVDPYQPKVVRAAMGALFRVRIARSGGTELLAAALTAGRPVVVADMAGEPLESFRFPARAVLAVGHERHGVAGWLPGWDAAVRIPQQRGESLNAAVAGSILLYAMQRARGVLT